MERSVSPLLRLVSSAPRPAAARRARPSPRRLPLPSPRGPGPLPSPPPPWASPPPPHRRRLRRGCVERPSGAHCPLPPDISLEAAARDRTATGCECGGDGTQRALTSGPGAVARSRIPGRCRRLTLSSEKAQTLCFLIVRPWPVDRDPQPRSRPSSREIPGTRQPRRCLLARGTPARAGPGPWRGCGAASPSLAAPPLPPASSRPAPPHPALFWTPSLGNLRVGGSAVP